MEKCAFIYALSVSCAAVDLVNASPGSSSVCSSGCNSFASDGGDDLDASVGRKSSPPSTTDCRLRNDHPLNLTKRKDGVPVGGTRTERSDSPGRRVSTPEPASRQDAGPTDLPSPPSVPAFHRPSSSSSSFSLKTSPSKFLSSPTAERRRGRSKVRRPADGWSPVQLGASAAPPLQPPFDNTPASMLLSTSTTALDRVSAISYS